MHESFIHTRSRSQQWFGRFCFGAVLTALAHNPVVAGETIRWVENARLYPGAIMLHARMDFERDGAKWIHVEVADRKGHVHLIERPIVRTVYIKQHKRAPAERPAIELGIRVGPTYKEVEVNVVERTGFNYPLLVGRNFLAGDFLVDSSSTFTSKPACVISSRKPEKPN